MISQNEVLMIEVIVGIIVGIELLVLFDVTYSRVKAHNTIAELNREVDRLRTPYNKLASEIREKINGELSSEFEIKTASVIRKADEDVSKLKGEVEAITKAKDDLERRNIEMSGQIDTFEETISKLKDDLIGAVKSDTLDMTDEILGSINETFMSEYAEIEADNREFEITVGELMKDIKSKNGLIQELNERIKALTDVPEDKPRINANSLRNLRQFRK